jgi:predicted esterase
MVAGIPVLVAVPAQVTSATPLVIMYHGFGPPNSPRALAKVLVPIPGAVTAYPPLPLFGGRAPPGGTDELVRRQNEDYIGLLLFPAISGAAREMSVLTATLSESYGLSKSRPVVIFGFSAGGAAALLSLTATNIQPRAVLVLNAPLSINEAVDGFERQTGKRYLWTEAAKEASLHYDVVKDADKIATSNPDTAMLLVQSEQDRGFSPATTQAAALTLSASFTAHGRRSEIGEITLPGSDHYVLDAASSASDHPEANMIAAQAMISHWLRTHAFNGGSDCS